MLYVVACPFNQTLLLPLYTTWKERKYASFSLISLLSGRSSLTDEFPWRCCGRAHQRNEPSGKPNNNQQQRQQNKHSKKKQPGRSGIAKRTRRRRFAGSGRAFSTDCTSCRTAVTGRKVWTRDCAATTGQAPRPSLGCPRTVGRGSPKTRKRKTATGIAVVELHPQHKWDPLH